MRDRPRRCATAVAALAAGSVGALAATSIALATIPSSGVISACYSKSGGTLRVPDATGSCSSKETALAWNVEGARGPAGPAGPAGATGPAGPPGVTGYEIVHEQVRELATSGGIEAFGFSVSCPAGKSVLGGGVSGNLFDGDAVLGPANITNSAPFTSSSVPASWVASMGRPDGTAFPVGQGVLGTVFVICANVAT